MNDSILALQVFLTACDIKSGSIGINITHSQDTAVPIGVNLRNVAGVRSLAYESRSRLKEGVKIRKSLESIA